MLIVTNLRKAWTRFVRTRWVNRNKALLKKGKVREVVDEVRNVCKGLMSSKIAEERRYFERNTHRMNYAKARRNKLPIGSGPMESAIRRLINLRLKVAGIFWIEENAEGILMLRAYYRAGRWDDLKRIAIASQNFDMRYQQ